MNDESKCQTGPTFDTYAARSADFTGLFSMLITRREFITLLGGAAVWPLAARAQQRVRPIVLWQPNTESGSSPRMKLARGSFQRLSGS
jgi:hypothetical protein